MKSKSKFTPKSNLTNESNSNLELVMNANCRLQVPIPTSRLPLVGAQMSRYAGKTTSLLLRSLDLWLRFVWKLLSSDYFEVVPLPPKFLHYEIFSMFFFTSDRYCRVSRRHTNAESAVPLNVDFATNAGVSFSSY